MRELWIAAVCVALLAGCKASHLAYVHEQTVGLDVAVSAEGTNKINVGYAKDTFALVPSFESKSKKGDPTYKAMSLTALSRTYIEGLSNIEIEHCLATGDAAKEIANDANVLSKVAKKIFEKEKNDDSKEADDDGGGNDAGGGS